MPAPDATGEAATINVNEQLNQKARKVRIESNWA
jgi:hypothetical protein